MNIDQSQDQIPFSPGDWVTDKNNLGQSGQYTGKGFVMARFKFHENRIGKRYGTEKTAQIR